MRLAITPFPPGGAPPGRHRIAIGAAVSLALHALFLLAYRHANLPAPPLATAGRAPLVVTILAPPASPEPAARVEPPAAARPGPRPPPRTAPRAVIAVPDAAPAQSGPVVVQQEPAPTPDAVPDQAPRFDMDAARRVARAHAHLRDPAKEGTALAQFPEPPLQTESTLARAIGAARRPDCKDGLPGGLLAPVYLLMQKKDSGCKW